MPVVRNDAELGEVVPGEGPITLRYFDTHPGASGLSESYTTIVATHGMGVNSEIWKSCVPYLAKDTRFLAYNTRGYKGSSPSYGYADPEHPNIDATKRDTLDLLGFVRYAVEQLRVPPMDPGRKNGGVVILGWSKGCFPLVGLLANLSTPPTLPSPFPLPVPLTPFQPLLHSHLRSLILLEPPGSICGLIEPSQESFITRVPPAERGRTFISFLRMAMPEGKQDLFEEAAEEQPVGHDMWTWLGEPGEGCAKVADAALAGIPLELGVGFVYCTGTVPSIMDAVAWFKPRLEGKPNVVVKAIPGGDHFAMATIPEAFASAIGDVITALAERAGRI